MNKIITIIIGSIIISSCGVFDYDMPKIDIHNKERDGWRWIEWKNNEIIIDHYKPSKGDWGSYCPVTGADTCMIQRYDDFFYIEINVDRHDYETALDHFKKHILLWESSKSVIFHHKLMDNCRFQCNKVHTFYRVSG